MKKYSNEIKGFHTIVSDKQLEELNRPQHSINVNVCCRLCMKTNAEMVKILQNNAIIQIMRSCLSIDADVDKGMPNMVCNVCMEVLNRFAKFRKKCKIVDAKLRQIVRKNHLIQQAQQLYAPGFAHLETVEEDNDTTELAPDTDFTSVTSSSLSVNSEGSVNDNISDAKIELSVPNHHSQNTAASSIPQNKQEISLFEEVVSTELEALNSKRQDSNNDNDKYDGDEEYGEVETLLIEEEDLIQMEDIKIEALENYEESEDNRGTVEVQVSLDGESYIVEVLGKTTAAGLGLSKGVQPSSKKKQIKKTRGYKLPVPEVLVVEDSNRERHLAFRCRECEKVYDNRLLYRRHASSHVGRTGLACRYCNKWFPVRSGLIRHERIHSGDKPYMCLLCNRSFTQKEILRRHVLTHSDSKPFKCKHCEKSYTQRDGLRTHIRNIHTIKTAVLQYACALCDKAFCHPSGLSRHLQTHTGKRHICKYCSGDFTDASSLRRHILNLHPMEDPMKVTNVSRTY